MPAFDSQPLWLNAIVFAAAAAVVWIAGAKVAGYADEVARRTGIGHAAAGLLLLAGVTSLPELAVTITAAVGNNAQLAVNNLLGSIAMQVAVLAVADAVIGKDALTSVIPDPVVLLQLALNILLLALFTAAVVTGDVAVAGMGAWSIALLAGYAGSVWLIAKSQGKRSWSPTGAKRKAALQSTRDKDTSTRSLVAKTAAAGGAILVAGWLVAKTGEAIAEQSGLGQSFGGFALVAISTSLPEMSTVIASVRLRQYVMAVSDIFGTNLFNIGLVGVLDATYRGGPILNEVGRFAAFAALLGIVVTAIFLCGLIERRDRTVARMGVDSFATLVVYAAGLALLYTLR